MGEAVRFWEPRRASYNLILVAVVVVWVTATWPHFRAAFTFDSLRFLIFAAVAANVCYSAAYLVDVPLRRTLPEGRSKGWQWALWTAGTLFAFVLANYWISDEIYPFVR